MPKSIEDASSPAEKPNHSVDDSHPPSYSIEFYPRAERPFVRAGFQNLSHTERTHLHLKPHEKVYIQEISRQHQRGWYPPRAGTSIATISGPFVVSKVLVVYHITDSHTKTQRHYFKAIGFLRKRPR